MVSAKDKTADEENNLVAIKKIEKAFEHRIFSVRTLRELKILRLLQHENVLTKVNTLISIDNRSFNNPATEVSPTVQGPLRIYRAYGVRSRRYP